MKKTKQHFKTTKKSSKKVLFTSIAVVLVGGISIGSYFVFNSNPSPSQKQSLNESNSDSNLSLSQGQASRGSINDSQENTEAISVSKVKSSELTSEIKNSLSQNTNFELWNQNCEPNLIVVNKDNPLPKGYQGDIVNFKEVQVSNIMKDNLYRMINDASKEGINLWISSAYRSLERQETLYNKEVESQRKNACNLEEAKRLASNVVAEPGKSEHNTGLAVDFNGVRDDFFKSKEYNWLEKNSAKYGFILRYRKEKSHITNIVFEPWHFRYVGEEHAKIMNEKDLCLEEYINFLNN